jgi:hypothetical protein
MNWQEWRDRLSERSGGLPWRRRIAAGILEHPVERGLPDPERVADGGDIGRFARVVGARQGKLFWVRQRLRPAARGGAAPCPCSGTSTALHTFSHQSLHVDTVRRRAGAEGSSPCRLFAGERRVARTPRSGSPFGGSPVRARIYPEAGHGLREAVSQAREGSLPMNRTLPDPAPVPATGFKNRVYGLSEYVKEARCCMGDMGRVRRVIPARSRCEISHVTDYSRRSPAYDGSIEGSFRIRGAGPWPGK